MTGEATSRDIRIGREQYRYGSIDVASSFGNARAPNIFMSLFLVLTLVGVINACQSYFVFFRGQQSAFNFFRFLSASLIYSWFFILFAYAVRRLSARVGYKRNTALPWLAAHLACLSLVVVLHQALSFLAGSLILGEVREISILGSIIDNPSVWADIIVYCLFVLGFYLIEYIKIDEEKQIECTGLEAELSRARLHDLRGRIRPDFLFNVLDSIHEKIRDNRHREANLILSGLGDFLRTSVYENEKEEVLLVDELRSLNQYLAIERARKGESLRVAEDIDDSILDALVPNFIFQPVVEELIDRAGKKIDSSMILKAGESDGRIEIAFAHRGYDPKIPQLPEMREGESIPDLNERLANSFGNDYELVVRCDIELNELVMIKFPLRRLISNEADRFGIMGNRIED